LIGGYGPAIGGILTLGLKNGLPVGLPRKSWIVLVPVSALVFGLLVVRYRLGNIPGYDSLPENLALSVPVIAAALLACLIGGWVISHARSTNPDVRGFMGSILPVRLPLRWMLFALFFYAGLVLVSWGASSVLGIEVEYPGLWGHSAQEVLPLFALSFTLTALIRGGMEEPGWRGMLLPELQRKSSPLVASLLIAVVWSLWHLPLYLNGFYTDPLVGGMIGGFVFRIFLSIFLTWVYNRTGGSLFCMIVLHTSFNMVANFIPTSDLVLMVLWIILVAVVVVKDKMYSKLPGAAEYRSV
jgi:membrane protease YdiL (CAAX protease family)